MTIDGVEVEEWRGRLHDTRAAAKYLGLAPQTLIRWRCEKSDGIPYRKLGNRVFYLGADLIDYVDRVRRTSTTDSGRAA